LHLVAALLRVNVNGLNLIVDLQSEAQALFCDAGPAIEWDDDQSLDEEITRLVAGHKMFFGSSQSVGCGLPTIRELSDEKSVYQY
jgi:hypothetical protein